MGVVSRRLAEGLRVLAALAVEPIEEVVGAEIEVRLREDVVRIRVVLNLDLEEVLLERRVDDGVAEVVRQNGG